MRPICFIAVAMRGLALAALLTLAGRPACAADAILRVTSGSQTLALTPDDVHKLPHIELTATDPHQNASHVYSGVPMRELLAKVGAPLGERMRGPALRLAVVFHAADGYTTVFALAEFDEAFSDRQLILADAQDGKPLPPNAGPYRLVVPGDKRAARWARMITSIEVVSVNGTTS
ncbi:MAG TPA: molybdopterin-dependent oxidoreductase [Opitutaceae bacterium]|jgi:DMSO/TMAO reductase YedYZ molybdopterin-dependent catalytic subunit